MDRQQVIEMACRAEVAFARTSPTQQDALETFAHLVAERAIAEALVSMSHAVAEEREACAKTCDTVQIEYEARGRDYYEFSLGAETCAAHIRTRSNAIGQGSAACGASSAPTGCAAG